MTLRISNRNTYITLSFCCYNTSGKKFLSNNRNCKITKKKFLENQSEHNCEFRTTIEFQSCKSQKIMSYLLSLILFVCCLLFVKTILMSYELHLAKKRFHSLESKFDNHVEQMEMLFENLDFYYTSTTDDKRSRLRRSAPKKNSNQLIRKKKSPRSSSNF